MALQVGIVGLPNVGKSTLFNALTRAGALAANYPFATIEPNTGVVPVPDARLPVLAQLSGSERQVAASVTFTDIAGLVRGAAGGAGLGNQFLAHIREADAVAMVVRAFEDPDVVHVDGRVDPASDVETILTELALADLQTLERSEKRLEQEAKRDPKTGKAGSRGRARRPARTWRTGRRCSRPTWRGAPELRELFLLTDKPVLYVFNVDEEQLGDAALHERLVASVAPAPAVVLCASVESELAEMDDESAAEMLSAYGLDASGLDRLATLAFDGLGLQTYLTTGPKESRAWTVRRGATAPEAAGVIHTDFQRGFIKAEVVSFDDLVAAGSWSEARTRGTLRTEGKDYVMADGDVVEFRFNV